MHDSKNTTGVPKVSKVSTMPRKLHLPLPMSVIIISGSVKREYIPVIITRTKGWLYTSSIKISAAMAQASTMG